MLEDIILFVFTFFIVYGVYALMILNSKKRLEAYKSSVEMNYLKGRHHIKIEHYPFKKLARTVLIVNTLDICLTAAIASLVPNFILKFIVGFIVLFVMIFVSYEVLGHFLKKREGKM